MPNLTIRLRSLADRMPDREVSAKQRGIVAGLLEMQYPDYPELRRKYFLLKAFGVDSVHKLHPRQVRALLDWLGPVRDSDGRLWPCAAAASDVRAFEEAYQ